MPKDDRRAKRRGRRLALSAGVALLGVLALAAVFRRDLLAAYHLRRLQGDEAYLLEIATAAEASAERLAIRRYVAHVEGQRAVVRLILEQLDSATIRSSQRSVSSFVGSIVDPVIERGALILRETESEGYECLLGLQNVLNETTRRLSLDLDPGLLVLLEDPRFDRSRDIEIEVHPGHLFRVEDGSSAFGPRSVLALTWRPGPGVVPSRIAALKKANSREAEPLAFSLVAIGLPRDIVYPAIVGALGKLEKKSALRLLERAGDAIVPYVERELSKIDGRGLDERVAYIPSLHVLGPSIVPVLGELLGHPSAAVRSASARCLHTMAEAGVAAIPALIEALPDGDASVRRVIARALARVVGVGCSLDLEALVAGLQDPDAWVRARVAIAIGNLGAGAAAAVPALVRSLEDPWEQVRFRAAQALGEIGTAAEPALAPLKIVADRDSGLPKHHAERAIAEIRKALKDATKRP